MKRSRRKKKRNKENEEEKEEEEEKEQEPEAFRERGVLRGRRERTRGGTGRTGERVIT